MTDFDRLKQMDVDEIHRKTRITLLRLHDILDKKFDSIDPARAHGFIKILERELQLDLSEWVIEYDKYKQIDISRDSNPSRSNTLQIETIQANSDNVKVSTLQDFEQKSHASVQQVKNTKLNKQTIDNKQQLSGMNIEISMPKQQISYKTMIIVISSVGIAFFIALGIYFIGSNNIQENHVTKQNDTQKQAVEKDIKQAYPTISLYDALNDNEQKRERMTIKNDAHTNETPIQEQNATQEKKLEEDSRLAKQEIKWDAKESDTQEVSFTITPKQDVWFAWTDTITKMRGEKYTKKTPITLKIKNPTVFHFGYAVLTIEINGEIFEYNQRGVTYMLYDKKQGIRLITQKDYRALGGK